MTTVEGLLGEGEEPVYDLVLQQALAQLLVENGGAPVPIRITIEKVNT